MPENKNKRYIAEQHHGWEGLDPKMKEFWGELTTELGREPKFTSGKRNATDETGKNHNHSHHNHGMAIDIEADPEAYRFLMNDPKGLGLLSKYELGVLDETNPDTMKKTGATGEHFHIGPDTSIKNKAKQRYQKLISGGDIEMLESYKGKQILDEKPKDINVGIGRLTTGLEGFQREVEKEKVKEKKEEKSKARKEIEEAKKQITLGEDFFKSLSTEVGKAYKSKPRPSNYKPEDPIAIDPQTSLPSVPNIFQDITKFEDGGEKSSLLSKAISQVSNVSIAIDDRPNSEITSMDQIYPEFRKAVAERIKDLSGKDTLEK